METTERFNRAYDALVKAYFEGTLFAGLCQACAVGNMVLYANGGHYKDRGDNEIGYPSIDNTRWSPSMRDNLDSYFLNNTGYSQDELLKIEKVFERNSSIKYGSRHKYSQQDILEDQFKGLSAVVNLLLELDSIEPNDSYNAKFREHPKLITV